ncbi:hypothetical protein H6F67_12340 [Microcoleus sp. FACHB-1515]|uniref:hypothetical protein n=1 Tax=Cyanophyceae TaxID=3028117 RepID=UPI001683C11F|nr:hypothetical protein [Microcoleus sp. FACHB-1515]MBD2090643.1 hypothetical protein [Microcoleus sp. FACHB-1515]
MNGWQLELWDELRSAQMMPEQVDVVALLDAMDAAIDQMPEADRLQVAGEALLQVAELCAVRAEVLMTEWEEVYRDPIVDRGFFSDMVRQTMSVDLTELMEPASPRQQRTKSIAKLEGSIAAPVEKTAVLTMIEQLETETAQQQVLDVTHSEDVTGWVKAIALSLQATSASTVSLTELSERLGMPQIEVWLGVLLGGFELEQCGEFYHAPIWVGRSQRSA